VGIDVPPLVATPFRADTLTILELSHFGGIDAKPPIVGEAAGQPKMALLFARHDDACPELSPSLIDQLRLFEPKGLRDPSRRTGGVGKSLFGHGRLLGFGHG